jgi:hypothetical protein
MGSHGKDSINVEKLCGPYPSWPHSSRRGSRYSGTWKSDWYVPCVCKASDKLSSPKSRDKSKSDGVVGDGGEGGAKSARRFPRMGVSCRGLSGGGCVEGYCDGSATGDAERARGVILRGAAA